MRGSCGRRRPLALDFLAAWVALTALAVTVGCGQEPRTAEGRLDTPRHHTLRGHDFIDKGDWKEAERSFDLALSLGKPHGPAYAGKAIVEAQRATAPGLSADQREDIFERAEDLMEEGLKLAATDGEKRVGHVAAIRVHRMTRFPKDKWVAEAKQHYDNALKLDPRRVDPDPHLYMARAYRDAFDLRNAEDLYRTVLGMNTPKTGQADSELAVVQKIIRAQPGTRHGREIAFEPALTRADLAALFIEEMRLDRLYARGNRTRFDNRFKTPAGSKGASARGATTASDINRHPLRADIQEVMKLGVAGLQPDAGHRFHPNQPVQRAQFAMMVQDILIQVTGENGLSTRFIGQASPFADVRNDHYSFNAIQTVTSRALMEPVDKVNGVFGPARPVTGADALLVLRLLKDELRRYVR